MTSPCDRPWTYSALPTRQPGRWPGGQRLALWIALGVEDYQLLGGMTEDIIPGVPAPDLVNAAWRDYGNRAGVFRLLDMLADAQLPTSLLLNTVLYDTAPAIITAARRANCEIIAHGHSNSDTLAGMSDVAELDYLRSVFRTIETAEGTQPRGWSSPWLAQNTSTLANLVRAGFRYLLDWRLDDQPVWLTTEAGPLLSIPYAAELNDSTTIIGRQSTAHDFAQMIIDEIDQLLDEVREQPAMTSIVLHSFISGQPFRTRALRSVWQHIEDRQDEIWLTRPSEIHKISLSEFPSRAE